MNKKIKMILIIMIKIIILKIKTLMKRKKENMKKLRIQWKIVMYLMLILMSNN